MTDTYKGQRIQELMEDLKRAETIFNEVNTQSLDDKMFRKLAYAKSLVCISKAKLTSLIGDENGKE